MRCIALFSGGLDSQLAVRLLQRQGNTVRAVYFRSPWSDDADAASDAAAALGVPLSVVDFSEQYALLLRQPRFGHVAGAAPCLDCRIAMLSRARELLAESEFVVTGEVVGQRVRSAVRDLEVIAHHAGLEGRLLRPLSAKLLPLTEPEQRGWVDRSQLLALQGKSRRSQERLAAELGLSCVPPRPDCPLLSDPLATRVLELIRSPQPLVAWDLELLALGRQVRLNDRTRVVVGRNREENERLTVAAKRPDANCSALLFPANFFGPTALLVGEASEANVQHAARIVVRYSRNLPPSPVVHIQQGGQLREIPLPP